MLVAIRGAPPGNGRPGRFRVPEPNYSVPGVPGQAGQASLPLPFHCSFRSVIISYTEHTHESHKEKDKDDGNEDLCQRPVPRFVRHFYENNDNAIDSFVLAIVVSCLEQGLKLCFNEALVGSNWDYTVSRYAFTERCRLSYRYRCVALLSWSTMPIPQAFSMNHYVPHFVVVR